MNQEDDILEKVKSQNFASLNEEDLFGFRRRFTFIFWLVISITIILFILSVTLLLIPVLGFTGRIPPVSEWQNVISAASGLLVLFALFRFRPYEKIHKLTGDMSQITLVFNNYQTQVKFQLSRTDAELSDNINEVCDKLMEITQNSMDLIQLHYKDVPKQLTIDEFLEDFT